MWEGYKQNVTYICKNNCVQSDKLDIEYLKYAIYLFIWTHNIICDSDIDLISKSFIS